MIRNLASWLKAYYKSSVFMIGLLVGGSIGGALQVSAQSSESYNWRNVPIGGGGFVSAIIPSKTQQNLVYARTDVGGAYRWNTSTNSWIPLMDWVSEDDRGFLGVESLALDPNNPGRLYMLVGIDYFSSGRTAILRSNDFGNTFTITEVTNQFRAHGNGMGRQTGEKLVVDPNNSNTLYCGTRAHGLFRSTNAGANWSRVTSLNVTTTPNANGISFVVLDPSSNSGGSTQRMFVGVSRSGSAGANFYRSDNGGQSFTAVQGAPTNYMPHRAVLASNGNLYVTYGDGAGPHGHWSAPEPMENGQIWRYNISSGTWTNVTPSGISRAFGGISVDPNNPNRIVASTVNNYMPQYEDPAKTGNDKNVYGDRIFLSTNGGSSWVDVVNRGFTLDTDGISWIFGHAIHWAGSIEFDPFNTQKVWVTSGNGIFVNDNINTSGTWKFTVRGIEETVPLGLESIPNGPLVSVIGDYDGFRHTNINQYAPIHNPRMGTTTGLAVAAQNTSKIVRVGNSMYYSTDMGVTWTQNSMNGTQGKVALSANGNTVLHSPRQSSTTYRSTNNGSSWSTASGLNFNEAFPVGDPVNSNRFYAYNPGNGAVMVSTNGGSSFSQASSVASGGSKVIRLAPGREGHVWIALNDGGLVRSTNAAQSFTTINGISYCGAVGFGMAAPGANYPTVYIWGTINNARGVYRSTDQGATWSRVNTNAQQYGGPGNGEFVQGDMNVFGRVYMSTAGRGIVYGEPSGSSGGGTIPNGTYVITARNSGRALDVNARGTTNGSNVIQWAYGGGTNQQWILTSLAGGFYRISPAHASSMALDVSAFSSDNGANVQIWSYLGGNNQQWSITDAGNGYFRISARHSGKCLDVSGFSTENGGNIHQWDCTGNVNQQWSITPVSSARTAGSDEEDPAIIAAEAENALGLDLKEAITIFPNPSHGGKFLISLPEIQENLTVSVHDSTGKLIYLQPASGNMIEVNTELKTGIYVISLYSDAHFVANKRLVVR